MPTLDSNAWITLNDAKEHLHIGISETEFDDQLINLANRSYKILEKYLGRQMKSQSYTEYYDGPDEYKLVLRKYPVVSVTTVHVDIERDFGSDTLVDSGNYFVDTNVDTSVGTIEFFDADGSGPVWFEPGIRNVKVVYTAGFATIPNDLVHAGCMHVAWLFKRSDTEAMKNASLGGKTESYESDMIPHYIKQVLLPYKDWAV